MDSQQTANEADRRAECFCPVHAQVSNRTTSTTGACDVIRLFFGSGRASEMKSEEQRAKRAKIFDDLEGQPGLNPMNGTIYFNAFFRNLMPLTAISFVVGSMRRQMAAARAMTFTSVVKLSMT